MCRPQSSADNGINYRVTCILALFQHSFKTPLGLTRVSYNQCFLKGHYQPAITSLNFHVLETESDIKISDLRPGLCVKTVSDYFKLPKQIIFIWKELP